MGKPRKYPIRSVDKILTERINIPRRNVSLSRKHSSRMRTARFCGSGGAGGRELVPGRCGPDGVWSQGRYSSSGWGIVPGALWEGTRSPVNRLTDTCENITFPQLRWWTVNIKISRGLLKPDNLSPISVSGR